MEREGGAFQPSINFLSDLDNICHRWDATAPRPFQVVEAGPVKAASCDWSVQGTHDRPWVPRAWTERTCAGVVSTASTTLACGCVRSFLFELPVERAVDRGYPADSQHGPPCFPRAGHLVASSALSSRRPTRGARAPGLPAAGVERDWVGFQLFR